MCKDSLKSHERTQTNFTSVPALSPPPIIFMIVSSFDKSYERQAKQKKEVISRQCAPSRTQNKAETNILTNSFFHCFNIPFYNSNFYTVSNLSDSVRTTISERPVRLFHQPWFVHRPVLFQTANCSLLAGSLYNLPSDENSLTTYHHHTTASQMSTLN